MPTHSRISRRSHPFYDLSLSRVVGTGFVVLLHIGIIYALVNGLARRTVDVVRAAIETKIIDAAIEKHLEPPPPPPRLRPLPPPFIPPPDIRIEAPAVVAPTTAITAVTTVRPPVVAPPPPPEPARVEARINLSASREPEYPPNSRRLGEHGSLMVQALINTNGRAIEVKLLQSSGFPRLDQAALVGIKDSYRFIPATVDGKPEQTWFTFKFTWKLR